MRIENELTPVQNRQFGGGGAAGGELAFGRGQEIERDIQLARALGRVDVEVVHAYGIAPPGDSAATGFDGQSGKLHHRPIRRVVARNPLRVEQRNGAAGNRHVELDVKNAPRSIGGIHVHANRCLRKKGRSGKQNE